MSSSVGEVVAHLLAARDRLGVAAVTASRARADADQASAYYCEAARGSDHPKVRSAIVAVGVAGAKSDRVARLINEVREHITAYVNHIAPGAAPTDDNASESLPDGDRLVTEASRAANRARRLSRRVAQNAENVGDLAKKITEYFEAARPTGTAATTQNPKAGSTDKSGGVLDADGAQAVAIVAAAVLAAAMKAGGRRRERKERGDDE